MAKSVYGIVLSSYAMDRGVPVNVVELWLPCGTVTLEDYFSCGWWYSRSLAVVLQQSELKVPDCRVAGRKSKAIQMSVHFAPPT